MAKIYPFCAHRYSAEAGPIEKLVTQPYDKITPEMRSRYLAASPHNLVRVILGEPQPGDSEKDNIYTRAAQHLDEWIQTGILRKDQEPSFFAYFQEFTVPDTGEKLTRKGLIGLGEVEDYSAGVVFRHEQTLSGPKKDRLELLRHTNAHFGQLFMLYSDPSGEIDQMLDEISAGPPDTTVTDEYGAHHRLWRISNPPQVAAIREKMADKRLLIADGHHRYETALAFRREHPDWEPASKVMMTLVNMHSPGVKILATHRLVSNIAGFSRDEFLAKAGEWFDVHAAGVETLSRKWIEAGRNQNIVGAAIGNQIYSLALKKPEGKLDVSVLHETLLGRVLGIGEEAVRDERHLRYMRGLDKAVAEAAQGRAQIAFLLKPASVEPVAEISFAGGVMPQKSTDFYPKMLSGLTIYKL